MHNHPPYRPAPNSESTRIYAAALARAIANDKDTVQSRVTIAQEFVRLVLDSIPQGGGPIDEFIAPSTTQFAYETMAKFEAMKSFRVRLHNALRQYGNSHHLPDQGGRGWAFGGRTGLKSDMFGNGAG